MNSKNFKITNNKIKVITVMVIMKKSNLKPKLNSSNPTIVGINTINPDRSRLFTNMLFLTRFTLKSRFL